MTELTVPTTHRLLKTLNAHGFLSFDPTTKTYGLGAAVMELAGAIMRRGNLQAEALPELQGLRRRTGETASLHLLVDGERVCVMELVSKLSIRISSGVGHRYPLHRGAAGKALLAAMPEETCAAYLAGLGDALDVDRDELLEELATTRKRGYALSEGEVIAGAVAVAVAVRDASGRPIAAVNVTGPAKRWPLDRAESFSGRVREAAATIEANLTAAEDREPADA